MLLYLYSEMLCFKSIYKILSYILLKIYYIIQDFDLLLKRFVIIKKHDLDNIKVTLS